MFDAYPLTLNALVPGCCCLDAGFWWSVAIVNRSARRKLKRNKLELFVTDKYLWMSYKKFNIYLSLNILSMLNCGPLILFSHTHLHRSIHPSPSKIRPFQASEDKMAAIQNGMEILKTVLNLK